MRILLIVLLFLIPTDFALGQESDDVDRLSITGTAFSKHMNTRSSWNEINPGVGVEYQGLEWLSTTAGIYYNSENRITVYGGAIINMITDVPVRPELMVGLASGYTRVSIPEFHTIIPIFFVALRVDITDQLFIRGIFLPPIKVGVIAPQIGYTF